MNLREMALKARVDIANRKEVAFEEFLQQNSEKLLGLASRGSLSWELDATKCLEIADALKECVGKQKFIAHPEFGPLTFQYKYVEAQRMDFPRIFIKFGSPDDTI
jgi:hypothetical protein